ncbi:alpha/beta fold hydrolase [Jatrophihabitans sp. YIM 134969]
MTTTSSGIAYDRAGPRGATPLLLVHAGICDRRMWDPVRPALTAERDVLRLDLRGYGGSTARPDGPLDPVADVLDVLDAEGVERVDVVGCSFGAGVAVELALTRPAAAASLLLAAPGGVLLAERTDDFAAFVEAERAAVDAGDLDAAAAVNVRWWVVGPDRSPSDVPEAVRTAVHEMQRRAFELTVDWDDVEETELDPPALERLADVSVPTTVLLGRHDLQTVHGAAAVVAGGIPGAVRVDWDDVAHLPSMEQPDRFVDLVLHGSS